MEESNNAGGKQKKEAGGGGNKQPARTHWRRRDPAATAVYVVHPTQFRDVVQQLTGSGAPASPARARDQGVEDNSNGGGAATATAAPSNAAAARHRQYEGGASKGVEESSGGGQRTLGQMHQECMAWANSDDDDPY